MCGQLLWVPAFHLLYLSHLDTSDSLFECSSLCGFKKRGERWKAEGLGQCLSLLCFHGISFLQDSVVMIQEWQFWIWQWEQKCTSLPTFPFVCLVAGFPASCTAVCAQLHTPAVNPQVWYPDMAEGHEQTNTDSLCLVLSSPENLHDFESTSVIPFYSWYEGK